MKWSSGAAGPAEDQTRGTRAQSAQTTSGVTDLFRYRALIKNLVLKDLKLKYRDSVFGAVWSLLHPLLMILVYTVAFKHILRVGMENYAYFLLVGLLPWSFFSSSLVASTQAITGNANLIRKVYFPPETLPISTVLFTFSQLLLTLAVFLPVLVLVSGVRLHWSALLFVPLLLFHLLFTVGLAFMLAACTVFLRDVAHLTDVAVALLFWMTPIIYPVTMAPRELQVFFKLSPMAAFAIAYQDVLFWGRMPESLVLITVIGSTALALGAGVAVFRRHSSAFAEEV